jgi:hypothetical protein
MSQANTTREAPAGAEPYPTGGALHVKLGPRRRRSQVTFHGHHGHFPTEFGAILILPVSCISGYTNIVHPDPAKRKGKLGVFPTKDSCEQFFSADASLNTACRPDCAPDRKWQDENAVEIQVTRTRLLAVASKLLSAAVTAAPGENDFSMRRVSHAAISYEKTQLYPLPSKDRARSIRFSRRSIDFECPCVPCSEPDKDRRS